MCQAKSINLKGEATKDTRLMSATKDQDEDNSEEIVEMSSHYTGQPSSFSFIAKQTIASILRLLYTS